MNKYKHSAIERFAIWTAYQARCFYCQQPVDYEAAVIDHVVPEHLLADLALLTKVREDYQLEEIVPGFQINSFCNWVLTHSNCNRRKAGSIYPKAATLFWLLEAAKRTPVAVAEFNRRALSNVRSKVLGQLEAAIEARHVSVEEVLERVAMWQKAPHDPLVLSFYTRMDDECADDLPSDVRFLDYSNACDWLELDLVRHLRVIMNCRFHYTEPSERSGDGLGVRIVFLGEDCSGLDLFDMPWWEITQYGPFSEIFGIRYEEAFPYEVEKEYFGQLESDENQKELFQ